jgi:hypothetical protein
MLDKQKLEIMDRAVHNLARTNPVAMELKTATHRKGAVAHDQILGNAFTAMYELVNEYAKLYQMEEEVIDGTEIQDQPSSASSE